MKMKINTQAVEGYFSATHICKTRSGIYVPLSEVLPDHLKNKIFDVKKQNLVVNLGRKEMAWSLGGYYQTQSMNAPYIHSLILGDGNKSGNLPNLSDTGLVQEIQTLAGAPSGTFLINDVSEPSPEISFPPVVWRGGGSSTTWLSVAQTISINGDNETILTDSTVNFNTLSVQLTDQVTIDDSTTNPSVLGVREVRSATELVLNNPYGVTDTNVRYRVGTPGTQMLLTKIVEGNSFPQATWGPSIIVKEAGLLYNNGSLFNRVVFAPDNEEQGLLIQSDEALGVEVSVRFEWLITV